MKNITPTAEKIGIKKKMKSALVIGHFGARNFGDDLMLASICGILSDKDVHITVFAKSDNIGDLIDRQSTYISVLRRGSIFDIYSTMRKTDILILGGGTHFQDNFRASRYVRSLVSLSRFLALFTAARIMGVRIGWIGVGIGPARSLPTSVLIKICSMLTEQISVRDEASDRELRRLGIKRSRLGFDLVALLQDIKPERKPVRGDRTLMGVSLFSAGQLQGDGVQTNGFWSTWKDAIEASFRKHETLYINLIVFLDLAGELGDVDDLAEMHDRLARIDPDRVSMTQYTSTRKTLEAIASCDLFMAARYHSVITAGLFGIPMIVAPYDRKVVDAALQIGLEKHAIMMPTSQETLSDMTSRIDEILYSPERFTPAMDRQEAFTLSRQNMDAVNALLGGQE